MKTTENRDAKTWKFVAHTTLIAAALACVLPILLLAIASMTDESVIIRNGYSFFPEKLGFTAYDYLWREGPRLMNAYGVSILVTLVGSTVGVLLMAMVAYPLARKDLPARKTLMFLVVFTMLFNGGLVPTYFLYTQAFHIKNTIWALIVPNLLVSGFSILMLRTFFANSIPEAVIESARIDGVGEVRMLFQIVFPLATPILATVLLLQGINYWNDWFNGLIYLTDPKLFSMQNLLNRIIADVQFLTGGNLGSDASLLVAQLPSVTIRMAIAVVGILPMLIAYPFFQKYFVRGIAMGSVKG